MAVSQDPKPSEPLLLELAKIIAPRSRSGSEIKTLWALKRFFEYAKNFRNSSNPLDSLSALTKDSAFAHYTIIDAFLRTVTQAKQPLATLKFVFHTELAIPEHELETKQLILTVIADMPFTFDNWVGMWIQLTCEGRWEGVWAVTNYIRSLKDSGMGEPKWESAEVKWVCIHLARLAGVETYMLLRADEGLLGSSRRQAGNETSSSQTPRREINDTKLEPSQGALKTPLEGVRTPSERLRASPLAGAERASGPEIGRATSEMARRAPSEKTMKTSSPMMRNPSKSKGGIGGGPQIPVTPRSIPQKSRNIIDTIVTEYAQTPRIKNNSEEERRDQLLEFKRSEEEFNRKHRQAYKEYRSIERRDNRPSAESPSEHVRRDAAESILGRPLVKEGEPPKLVDLRTKLLMQEREIDDDKFEKWAMGLMGEGDDEYDKGYESLKYYY
ncbi:hypothetical protein TWF694_005187 [Orbilia ellipsospora]|uniref:Uncharacterized protein n=1 Tax=Orbilia ellipsospora TaxID=2528407 RepID=A0AAV9WW77_9PEZI